MKIDRRLHSRGTALVLRFLVNPKLNCWCLMLKTLVVILILSAGLWAILSPRIIHGQTCKFVYQHAPIDNPLKGLVPYWQQQGSFPCSMEFWYFPINELMLGPKKFDWQPINDKLEDMRSRGHHAVIRTYLEYPGRESALPQFLVDMGIDVTTYKTGSGINHTPDYHDPRLISAMEDFVVAFGAEFDGDPRVGFITMGILGHWGEWHTYPRSELFATKANQTKIQDAFVSAFKSTKVLMRYPAGVDDYAHAENASYPFGYHDDSFSWATLFTGNKDDSWFFEAAMMAAGKPAVNKWTTQPIGGEIRPEIWGCVFDHPSCAPKGQEFETCVERLHVTWLMDSGMFTQDSPAARTAEATRQARKMGYEFYVSKAVLDIDGQDGTVELTIENRGVAPFYYEWPVELVALDKNYQEISSASMSWRLQDLLPDSPATVWQGKINSSSQELVHVGVRIINPMENGKPIRFANANLTESGMLILNDSRPVKQK